MPPTVRGYLLLADITGYTSFMAGTELEHAQAVVQEVNDLVINSLTPTMTLAEVEGDAVFVYSPLEMISRGEGLVELVENTYVRFRIQREVMNARTTCTCKACVAIPNLDLKFVVHIGEFVMQSYGLQQKPVGSDVNLSHRLLKNSVTGATGWTAYALFTQKSLEAMGIQLSGLFESTESYEHFPPLQACSLNLATRYKEIIDTRRYLLRPEEVDHSFTMNFASPPFIVWEWLNDLNKRSQWGQKGSTWTGRERLSGRTSVGATNHCAHGSGESFEKILDWRPFEYIASEYTGTPVTVIFTNRLETHNSGTRLTWQVHFKKNIPRLVRRPLTQFISKRFIRMQKYYEVMRDLIEKNQNAN